jgi:hypothetical protein
MASYTLRLYKKGTSHKLLHELLQIIPIEASTDDEAIEKARVAQVPPFDNSDMAILFTLIGDRIWRLDL